MNNEKMNGCDIESTLEKIKEDIQDLLDGMIYKQGT